MDREYKLMEQKEQDDEIDLYELVETLMRHKWTIIITTVVCSLISLAAALYVRSKTPNYLVKNIYIQQEAYDLNGVNKINPDSVLLQDKNVKRILEIEEIKNTYLKETPKEEQNIITERKYLQDMINISKNDKNPSEVVIKTKIIGTESGGRQVVSEYIEILKEQDNLNQVIQDEKNKKSTELEKINENLKKLEDQMVAIFKNDSDVRNLKPEEKANYLSVKYPTLILKKNADEKYYNANVEEIIKLNTMGDNIQVLKETSDTYFVKGQSKAKLVLAAGVLMGIFLGIVLAFFQEFIEGYKKRYKK